MGSQHFSLDRRLAELLSTSLGADLFIESGTYLGWTAKEMASIFRDVHTIEASRQLHERARSDNQQTKNISFHLGDSPVVLKELKPIYQNKSAIFWLDAHWCNAPNTARVELECPLLKELEAIGKLNECSALIIDDARLFTQPPPPPHDTKEWPNIRQVMSALEGLSNKHLAQIADDRIIFYPEAIREKINAYLLIAHNARTHSSSHHSDHRRQGKNNNEFTTPARISLNGEIERQARSTQIFNDLIIRHGINAILDVGAHRGEFAKKMRALGFTGSIYSIEPVSTSHNALMANSRYDWKWIVLPRQAAGSTSEKKTINISENSYSSSLLSVADIHLKAAPQSKIINSEECNVTKAQNILAKWDAHSIQAIKIDVQGFELEVINGLDVLLEKSKLLMVELNSDECYKGCPDIFEIDTILTRQYGFRRVSLEPAYYDEDSRICQQYDGIYLNQEANINTQVNGIVGSQKLGVQAVVTSIPPTTGSDIVDQLKWRTECMESWMLLADNVISVSESDEKLPSIESIPTLEKPSINALIEAAASSRYDTGSQAILCNADIAFTKTFFTALSKLDSSILYYGCRTDVTKSSSRAGYSCLQKYELGFDYFIIPKFAQVIISKALSPLHAFSIGEPWWDYMLPIISSAIGLPIKCIHCNEALALHLQHGTRWDLKLWTNSGLKFLDNIKVIHSWEENRAAALTGSIIDIESSSNAPIEEKLHAIAQKILSDI